MLLRAGGLRLQYGMLQYPLKGSIGAGVNLANRKRKESCDFGERLQIRSEVLEARILTHNPDRRLGVPAMTRRNQFFDALVEAILNSCRLFHF